MMTADFTSSRLEWNSSIVDHSQVKAVKGSGKEKQSKAKTDITGMKKMTDSKVKDLDSLVATMAAKESPVPAGTGMKKKAKSKISKEDVILDSIAARYGIRKPKRKART